MGTTAEAAAPPPSARIAVGDEVGLLKVVHVPGAAQPAWDQTQIVDTWGDVDRQRKVCCMCLSPEPSSTGRACLAVGRRSGEVELLDPLTGTTWSSIPHSQADGQTDADASSIIAVHFLPCEHEEPSSSTHRLLSCTRGGQVRLHEADIQSNPSTSWTETASWRAGSKLECMAVDTESGRVAVGGEGSHVQVWDLSSKERVFQAKGGKPDRVGLVDPAVMTAVTFIPGKEGAVILAGTAQHKLYLYDTRIGRRPQMELAWGEARINTLSPTADGASCWVANASGHVASLDLVTRKMMGVLKGSMGSVRSLALHADPPVVASCGLDRYLRVHCTHNRKLLAKVYIKQQMTSVVFLPVPGAEATQERAAGEGRAVAEAPAVAGDDDPKTARSHPKGKKKKSKADRAPDGNLESAQPKKKKSKKI